MQYIEAAKLEVGDILAFGETVTSVVYPVEGDKVEVSTDDGNRVLWNSFSTIQVYRCPTCGRSQHPGETCKPGHADDEPTREPKPAQGKR